MYMYMYIPASYKNNDNLLGKNCENHLNITINKYSYTALDVKIIK